MTTIADVLTFIAAEATQDEINRIHDAANTRTKHLREIRAARVTVGTTVVITNIKPKALSGLSGVVKSIDGNGKYCTVTLDAASTRKAARARTRATAGIGFGDTSYDMGGIPLSCCDSAT